ncbi:MULTISPECIES: hypothetical protein [Alphaproteobacteria]
MMALFRSRMDSPKPANTISAAQELRPRGDSYVRIDRRDYPLRCWSPAGFTLAPYNGSLIERQKARVRMLVRDIHDPDGSLEVSGEIIVDSVGGGFLTARWTGLPKYKLAALAEYFSGKLSA